MLSAVVLSAAPGLSTAQTLGDELILSRLGDPVEVEIAVEGWQAGDLSRYTVGAGSAEQYELFGLEYQPILDKLAFSLVGPTLAGEVKVLISSREPVNEPFLELLLVLSWPTGSTLRDYVLLFDPPPVARTAPAPVVPVTVVQEVQQTVAVPPAESVVTHPPASPTTLPDIRAQTAVRVDDVTNDRIETPVPATDALDVARRQYRVRDGDTLWTIARQFQPAGATENLYQFLVSLHDLNRAAFINGNISLLQAGASLLIPTARDVSSINPATAQLVFEQRWADSTTVATGVAALPPPQFSLLSEPEPEQPAPEVSQPQPAAGTELPREEDTGGLATTVASLIAPAAVENVLTIEPELVPDGFTEQGSAGFVDDGADSLLAPSANPYLQQVNDSAREIRRLLESRERRMIQVEEQLLAMRIQMQEAQVATRELTAKLQAAAAMREQRETENLRNTALLGALVAALLVALVVALWKLRAVHWQMQHLTQFKPAGGTVVAATPPKSRVLEELRLAAMEIEEIMLDEAAPAPTDASDIERDVDKVPDIQIPMLEAVDYLAVAPADEVSEPEPDGKAAVPG